MFVWGVTYAAVGEAEFDGFFHCLGDDISPYEVLRGREVRKRLP